MILLRALYLTLPLHSIPDLVPLPLPLAHKEHIDAILDEQVVFTRDGEVQHFLVRWEG